MKSAEVTYISGTSYYISAGRQDGLAEGSEVLVVRDDSIVARLQVQYLSSKQSACVAVEARSDVKVGDRVRFVAVASSRPAVVTDSTEPYRPTRAWSPGGLHGRVGIRYLAVNDGAAGTGYGQPAGDLQLAGQSLGGSGLGLAVDLRARRTTTTLSDGTDQVDGKARAYEANLFWHGAASPIRLAVGRQYSQSLSAVSLFDGGLVELLSPRWNAGVFGGIQPDPDLAFSTDLTEFGGFVGVHSSPGSSGPWAVTTGLIASYFQGKANREFGYLQASYSGPVLSVYGSQELDYYRPWKVKAGENSISLTSTLLSANLRLMQESESVRGLRHPAQRAALSRCREPGNGIRRRSTGRVPGAASASAAGGGAWRWTADPVSAAPRALPPPVTATRRSQPGYPARALDSAPE